ncbi:MAG: hypothetical protein GXY05_01745 [Clostridiales bacterium]|nr:hypothetical protein [Clostridiales bacterium]
MISHKGTQEIKTERLLLRKIVPEDAEAVYKQGLPLGRPLAVLFCRRHAAQ